MPTSNDGSISPASSLHEKRNSPHPSKDFLQYKAPSQFSPANRWQYQRDISESFYQDYTGGNRGDGGTGVSTKGWGTYHGKDMYLGNALCNLAHDPAAPHIVNKNDLLRNISRTYSRSRSASGTRERLWSTHMLDETKKPTPRPRSQSAKSLRKREDASRDISDDVKRFLDSRSVEERSQIYKYLQDTDRTGKEGAEKESGEDNKSRQKKSGKAEGKKEPAKATEEPEKKAQEVQEVYSPRRHRYSEKYKKQRINKAQSATGTLFSVSSGRQPAHFAIFPDWPSEKDKK